jgi:hypothetical protein
MSVLHLEEEPTSSGASDVERQVAVLVRTLNASSHLLVANVAILNKVRNYVVLRDSRSVTNQFPSLLWNLVHFHDRFHKGLIPKGDFWNPNGAEEVRPSQGIGLLECTLNVRAENASLSRVSI